MIVNIVKKDGVKYVKFACNVCWRQLEAYDTTYTHIQAYLISQDWETFKSEGKWGHMCSECTKVPRPIDEDDEYDNLKDNELSLPQDSQREGN